MQDWSSSRPSSTIQLQEMLSSDLVDPPSNHGSLAVIQRFFASSHHVKEACHVVHEEEDDKDREANLSNKQFVAVSVGRLIPFQSTEVDRTKFRFRVRVDGHKTYRNDGAHMNVV